MSANFKNKYKISIHPKHKNKKNRCTNKKLSIIKEDQEISEKSSVVSEKITDNLKNKSIILSNISSINNCLDNNQNQVISYDTDQSSDDSFELGTIDILDVPVN